MCDKDLGFRAPCYDDCKQIFSSFSAFLNKYWLRILEAHCLTLWAGIPFCIFPFRREVNRILWPMFVIMMSVKWGMSLSVPKRLIVQNSPFSLSLRSNPRCHIETVGSCTALMFCWFCDLQGIRCQLAIMSQSQWQRNLLYSLVIDEHETDGGKQSPNSDKLSPRIVGGKGNLRI